MKKEKQTSLQLDSKIDQTIVKKFNDIMPKNSFFEIPERGIKIFKNDVIEFLKSLPSESVDMIVTDPAYSGMNQKMKFGNGRIVGNYGQENNDKWFKEFHDTEENYSSFLVECKRVLQPSGAIYIMFDSFSLLTLGSILRDHFDVKNLIVWDKVNLGMGHHFRRRHELIMYMTKNKINLNAKNFPDIWRVKRIHKAKYPTQKPRELFESMLDARAKSNYVVCDPFTGSSSSGIAAIKKDCMFIGNDISESACKISAERIKHYIQTGEDILQNKSHIPEENNKEKTEKES